MKEILVVEDNSNECNGLCRLLERAGYDVRPAADGVEALQQMEANSFDLLLVDIWMPRMNGIELLALLPETRPKTLVITGDESPEVLLLSLRQKAYGFISKPIDPEEFLQIVKRTLESPPDCDPIEVLSADPNWVELRFPCAIQAADRIESVVDQLNVGLPPKVRESVKTALHELLINAVKWGGLSGPDAQARIDYLRTRKFVMCRIADPGPGFESKDRAIAVEVPVAPNGAAFRHDGFGIQLAKSLVDELVFNESRNEIAMVKYLN
jgi:CheY-like chemotaxis protein/anti-sigma regulatory factor (Ser/Thr protein kinase)